MSAFINNLAYGLNADGTVSTMVVHHSGKGNTDAARGSIVLNASADVEYRLEKVPLKEGGDISFSKKVLMVCTKSKDFDKPKPVEFTIKSQEILIPGIPLDEQPKITAPVFMGKDEKIVKINTHKKSNVKWPHSKQLPLIKSMVKFFTDHNLHGGVLEAEIHAHMNDERKLLSKRPIAEKLSHAQLTRLVECGVLGVEHSDKNNLNGSYHFYYWLNVKAQETIDHYEEA
jgi:hypothetical protein